MNFSAETLVWVFAILGGLRIFIILRRREIFPDQYKKWAARLVIILAWFLGIYALVSFSRIRSLADSITDRYAWVATNGNGLWLRAGPSKNAEIVQDTLLHNNIMVPTKTRVIILEKGLNPETIDGQSGAWCKVNYKGHQGYCFDGWLMSQYEVLTLAESYVSYLGDKNKSKACALQTKWPDCENFASATQFGGITRTRTISSTLHSIPGEKAIWAHITYQATDPDSDAQIKSGAGLNCKEAGVVYEEFFLVKKQTDGVLKIADFMREKLRCPD